MQVRWRFDLQVGCRQRMQCLIVQITREYSGVLSKNLAPIIGLQSRGRTVFDDKLPRPGCIQGGTDMRDLARGNARCPITPSRANERQQLRHFRI